VRVPRKALLVLPLLSSTLSAQTITGNVRDLGSGDALDGATVSLLGRDTLPARAVQTDSLGAYRISAAAGTYRIRVTRIGYIPLETANVIFLNDSMITRDVFLKQQPARLATVDISEKPLVTATAANPHKFDLFLERRSRGFGFFLTHDEIKAKNVYKMQQLLQSIPGIKVRQDRLAWKLQSQHCPGKGMPGAGDDEARRPLVFIDGQLSKGMELLDGIDTSQIEGLEVYQGAGELPAEAIGQACFAIFIWLRTIGP